KTSLAKCELGFAIFLSFYRSTKELLEVAFLDQPFDDRIVDYLAEIEGLHLRADLRIGRMIEHILHGRRQHVGNALVRIRSSVVLAATVVVRRILLVPGKIRLDREPLVLVKALDGFGMRFDQRLG